MEVVITASGPRYLAMAERAAATYAAQGLRVTLQVPEDEPVTTSRPLRRFTWKRPPHAKPHASLKIAGWLAALAALDALGPDELVLCVDADTCCQRPLEVPPAVADAVRGGAIGAARDRQPGWPTDPADPWFVGASPGCVGASPRVDYVNSGVLLLAPACRPTVERCAELAATDALLVGRYGDQRVLNFVLATGGRSALLPNDWNAIRPRLPGRARILHFAGAGGDPESPTRQRDRHARACARVDL